MLDFDAGLVSRVVLVVGVGARGTAGMPVLPEGDGYFRLVLKASTVDQALRTLRSQPVDVVLLAADLPAPQLVQCVHAVRRAASTPLVVLTNTDDVAIGTACIAAGAQECMSRSDTRTDSLLRAVAYAVARSRVGSFSTLARVLQDEQDGGDPGNPPSGRMGTAMRFAQSLPEKRLVADDVSTSPPHEALSSRELDVFRLIARGWAIKEVAAYLNLSDKTVATYVQRIRSKTGLTSYVAIARYALQQGIVD